MTITAGTAAENCVGAHPSTSTPPIQQRSGTSTVQRRPDPSKSTGNIFLEKICMLNSKANPGIPIESAAQTHIQTILFEILFALIDAKPTGIADMDRCMQAALPPTIYHWILKNYSRTSHVKSPKPKGSSSDRKNAKLLQEGVSLLYKEYTGQKPDQKIVHELISIVECIATDILQWTGKYVKNIPHGQHGIGLQNLKIALSADKSLIDLTEMLKNDDDESSLAASEPTPAIEENIELDYEKLSKDMLREDDQYLGNLSLLVNVFKRKLEIRVAKLEPKDPKQYIDRIFGSVEDIYELSLRLHRFLQDAVEMSEIHCVGSSGLWELCEAKEFNGYLDYAKHFAHSESIRKPIQEMLEDPIYTDFFKQEDRAYGLTGCQTFQMAMKYILPKLLEQPLHHISRFTNHFLYNMIHLTHSDDDRIELRSSHSYLKQISAEISKTASRSTDTPIYSNRVACLDLQRSQREILQDIQRSIEGWQGREIRHKCSRLVKEGVLLKGRQANHISKSSKTDRYVFLFDNLLVLCKPKKSDRNHGYKFKSKFEVRKTDIYDIPNSEDSQHAFRIVATAPAHGDYQESTEIILYCRTTEEKYSWLSAIVDIHTRSLLDRRLEAYNKEEEKRIPLEIPDPDQYRFAEPDTDDHIIFEDYTSNSGIPVVRAATILKLVERLTYHLYSDAKFVQTFLTTYRSFCQPEQLLQFLIERYNVATPRALEAIDNGVPCSPVSRNFGGGPLAGRYDTVQSHGLSAGKVSNARLEQSYQRFRMEFQQPIQRRVISVCDQWLRRHYYDFENNPELVNKMVSFLNEAKSKIGNSDRWKIRKILDRIERSCHGHESEPQQESLLNFNDGELTLPRRTPSNQSQNGCQQSKPSILWHTVEQDDVDNYDLLSLHPVEIGRQLTLLHFDLYRVVKPIELVGCAWMKADKLKRSPQLMQCMNKTNMLIYWVTKSIVETESLEERVALVSRVLEIMSVFEDLNNFNGIIAFNSALGLAAATRLKATFEKLEKEKKRVLQNFKKLCEPHGSEMMNKLREVQPPVIPFIGTYLSSLCFLDESGKTKTVELKNSQPSDDNDQVYEESVKIDFASSRRTAGLIQEIQMYQNEPYQFQVEPSIRQFFESINPLDGFEDSNALEEYLFAQSKKIEPGKDDARTMEILKPKRPMKTLVSPGIKVPKNLKNHQAPPLSPNVYHRSAPRSFSKPLTTEDRSHLNTLSSATLNSPNEGSTFAIVDINPGNKPKFIGDAKPGTILEGRQLPTLRKSIPPPSPSLKSELPQEMAPPPLFPRRVSSPMTEDSPPRTASSECSFVFPPPTASSPTDSAWASSSEGGASPPSVPPVPPRRIVRGPYVSLPAPLPVDSVSKHFWRGELSPTSPTVSLSVPLHTDSVPRPPELPPRQRFSNEMEPPPRPPKKIPGKPLSLAILDGPAPPPLPPKTYKQRLQHK